MNTSIKHSNSNLGLLLRFEYWKNISLLFLRVTRWNVNCFVDSYNKVCKCVLQTVTGKIKTLMQII